MKMLMKILIASAILIAIPLIVALFVKKDYAVEREITINKPKQEVFDYVKLLKNQDNYSIWATMDPNMKKTYRGTDGTVGFVSAWESKVDSVGVGEQEIKKIKAKLNDSSNANRRSKLNFLMVQNYFFILQVHFD